ncbi:hypothetical protein [Ferrimonas pelagia]|uniref:Uncharacterized protein n=1 Tax=Ferrimonas pelagia TaxID=1177826 RepID=A0ABP9EXC1_9GAMM
MSNLLPVLTLLLGSMLTYYFGVRAKKNEAAHKYKEEQYAKLLIKLQGFVGATANAKTKREFFEEQYKSWLYCSDEVVEAMNHMVRLVIDNHGKEPEPEAGRKAIGNIVLAMRKDLHGKTSLDYKAFRYTDVH